MRTIASSTIISPEWMSKAAAFRQIRNVRVIDAEMPVAIGLAQALDQLGAQHVHRGFLEPAVAEQTQHQHDLGTVGLRQPLLERGGDARRGEVLVLDVDQCRAAAIMSR